MSNRTFTMVKPDAFSKGHSGAIIDKILKSGFQLVALKLTRLSKEKAGEFYAVHKGRPFYGELVDFMSSGPIIAAILEKDNAVADFRKLIGATDPAKADEGTIRKLFAASVGKMPSMAATATKMLLSKEVSSSADWKEFKYRDRF